MSVASSSNVPDWLKHTAARVEKLAACRHEQLGYGLAIQNTRWTQTTQEERLLQNKPEAWPSRQHAALGCCPQLLTTAQGLRGTQQARHSLMDKNATDILVNQVLLRFSHHTRGLLALFLVKLSENMSREREFH